MMAITWLDQVRGTPRWFQGRGQALPGRQATLESILASQECTPEKQATPDGTAGLGCTLLATAARSAPADGFPAAADGFPARECAQAAEAATSLQTDFLQPASTAEMARPRSQGASSKLTPLEEGSKIPRRTARLEGTLVVSAPGGPCELRTLFDTGSEADAVSYGKALELPILNCTLGLQQRDFQWN